MVSWYSVMFNDCGGYFLGHSFYLTFDAYKEAKRAIATLEASYPNTAYVYYEGLITDDFYHECARIIDESVVELLKQNNNIEKVYSHYAFPVGMIVNGTLEDEGGNDVTMVLSNQQGLEIDLSESVVAVEFYYPEQLSGEKIYISVSFLVNIN